MTTARSIIGGALTFHLNRLSPGETLDADLGAVCLDALNHIADEFNGSKSFLFREILTVSTVITGSTGVLGTHWPTLAPGDVVLGATYLQGTTDVPLKRWTMAQYANVSDKTISSAPEYYTPDGLGTIYWYPKCVSNYITLRTRAAVADFLDLDTDYSMPNGYKSGLAALLAEKMAPTMIGSITRDIATAARGARNRLGAQASNPAILGQSRQVGNIINGVY